MCCHAVLPQPINYKGNFNLDFDRLSLIVREIDTGQYLKVYLYRPALTVYLFNCHRSLAVLTVTLPLFHRGGGSGQLHPLPPQ